MQSPLSMQEEAHFRDASAPSPRRTRSITPAITPAGAASAIPAGLTLGQASTHLPHLVQASSIAPVRSFRAASKLTSVMRPVQAQEAVKQYRPRAILPIRRRDFPAGPSRQQTGPKPRFKTQARSLAARRLDWSQPRGFNPAPPVSTPGSSMRRSDLTICLITDEVSPSLDDGLAFAGEEGIGTVDLRVIDGRNVLALSRGELTDAARRVQAAGLSVSCICTPLLKWSPPGRTARSEGDQFGFALGDRRPREVYAQAFAAAEILGARNLRVFSYLAYDGYSLDDLREPIDDLLALAEQFDMTLHVENEGVCNIAGFAELEALIAAYRHPRLRALPD